MYTFSISFKNGKKFDRYFGTLHLRLEIPVHLYNINYFQGRVAREQL